MFRREGALAISSNPYAEAIQDRLVEFFRGLGWHQRSDGQFSGAGPFPHRDDVACNCDRAFYASPVSGSWCCFCSDHLGQASGTLRAFDPLKFNADLSLVEVQSYFGRAPK